MKAKGLKDKARREVHPHHTHIKVYTFTEEEIAIFWSQLCKEQRELCQRHFIDKAQYEDIKSAPEPEFD